MADIRLLARAVVAGLILAGCSTTTTEPRWLYPPASSCPALDPRRPVAPSAPLAGEFRPVSAAICTFEVVVRTGPEAAAGPWQWRSVRRTDGDLSALVAALRREPPRERADKGCPAMSQEPMYLALTDADGEAVVPAIPADSCGFRITQVDRAVAGLTWVTVDSR